MATTIQVKNDTFQVLRSLKKIFKYKSYDSVIGRLIKDNVGGGKHEKRKRTQKSRRYDLQI